MVDRNLDSNLVSELNSAHVRLTYFVKLGLDSGTLYLHDGLGIINWSSQNWGGLGDFGSIGPIEEGEAVSPYKVDLMLSGLDTSMMTEVLDNDYYLRPVTIYVGAKNLETGALVADPDEMWSGAIDKAQVTLGDQNAIVLSCESEFARFDQVNGATYSDADLQTRFSGDTFFQYLASMMDAVVIWAGGPAISGGGGGTRHITPRAAYRNK